VSSEANEICEKNAKKTILPEHVLAALKVRVRGRKDGDNIAHCGRQGRLMRMPPDPSVLECSPSALTHMWTKSTR
jgi:hypothetical protein